jgi:hypothetical protein
MALTKNVNAYANVVEAETYFEDRLDVAAWSVAPDIQKAQAIVTATKLLDGLTWVGTAVSSSQELAFPREGRYFDPKLGIDVDFETSTVPTRIIVATFELAYHLLNNDGLLDDTGTVAKLTLGTIELTEIRAAEVFPAVVKNLITPLLLSTATRKGDARMWWRAN